MTYDWAPGLAVLVPDVKVPGGRACPPGTAWFTTVTGPVVCALDRRPLGRYIRYKMRTATATAAIAILALALTSAANADSPRRALSTEHHEYTHLVMLEPTASITWNEQCGSAAGRFERVWAYKWDGKPLGRLRWNTAHKLRFWRDPEHGGRAKWNGETMTNRTSRNVLFAMWC